MPYEVATAMLTAPKARLTNTMRKRCWDARTKEYTHEGPMTMHTRFIRADEKSSGRDKLGRLRTVPMGYEPLDGVSVISPDQKLGRKLRALALARLERFMVRAARGRRKVQKEYVALEDRANKLGNTDHGTRKRIERAQSSLAVLSGYFERLMDHTEVELKRRESFPVRVIDPRLHRLGRVNHAN